MSMLIFLHPLEWSILVFLFDTMLPQLCLHVILPFVHISTDKYHRALIVSILKHYMGGFRPHFLDVCMPNKTLIAEYIGKHYQDIEKHNFFNSTICTGNKKAIKTAWVDFAQSIDSY